jgi:hypothetical protein
VVFPFSKVQFGGQKVSEKQSQDASIQNPKMALHLLCQNDGDEISCASGRHFIPFFQNIRLFLSHLIITPAC